MFAEVGAGHETTDYQTILSAAILLAEVVGWETRPRKCHVSALGFILLQEIQKGSNKALEFKLIHIKMGTFQTTS